MLDEERNTKESIKLRAEQEDPIIIYFVVNDSLGISSGKIAAQVAHAAQMLVFKYLNNNDEEKEIFNKYIKSSFRKVVLRADSKKFEKIKSFLTKNDVAVIDAGLTQVEPGTNTVLGFYPVFKSKCPKFLKKCQIL